MKFFKQNEIALVKSLIYGLIGGLYVGILFISRTKELSNQGNWSTYQELSVFEYVIKVLQTSIIISIGTLAVVLLYLYSKYQNSKVD